MYYIITLDTRRLRRNVFNVPDVSLLLSYILTYSSSAFTINSNGFKGLMSSPNTNEFVPQRFLT